MKKLLPLFILLFSFFFSFAQFPNKQQQGSATTLNDFLGAVRGVKGLINGTYTDTTVANAGNIDFYPGAQIFTTSDNFTWVRDATATRWINVTNGFTPTPTCGVASGTGVVTYDSLLIFDVSPATYALCCDNIPRTTLQDSIRLPAADPSNPVYVSIILDANGVNYVRGTPAANPAVPQLTNCQILLTTVLINAGDNVPANVSVNTIYDENYSTEWDSVRTVTMTLDTANTSFPVHLLKDIDVSSYTTNGYMEFYTSNSINLNDYGVLKFYVRLKGSATIQFFITWFLNGVQQTYSAVPLVVSGVTGAYQVIAMPTTAWRILNTSTVNQLRIQAQGTQGFYVDWIQLQAGIIPTDIVGSGTVTGETAVGNTLFTPAIATPNTTPAWTFPLVNAGAYKVWGNNTNVSATPSYITFNYATMGTGLLPVTNVAPSNVDGYMLATIAGVSTWVNVAPGYDTTIVRLPLVALPGTVRDTLTLPIYTGTITSDSVIKFNRSSQRFEQVPFSAGGGINIYNTDSSLKNNRTLDLNDHYLNFQNVPTGESWFSVAPSDFESALFAHGQTTGQTFLDMYANEGTEVAFYLTANDNTNEVEIEGDAIAQTIALTADTLLFNSTLSGATTGMVWKLKDATTGSGYWGTASSVNIYNSDGALTGDRTLSGATHNLVMSNLGSTYFQSGSDITNEAYSVGSFANGVSAISTKSSLYSNIGGTTSIINVRGVNGIEFIKDIASVTTDLVLKLIQLPNTSTSNILYYNSSTGAVTYGTGVSVSHGRSTAQTAANTNVLTYTVGASDGTFQLNANVLITTSTLHSIGVTVDYTDESNVSRTLTIPVAQLAGTLITAITNGTGAGPYEGVALTIRAKAATNIVFKTAGTFTTVTYNVDANIVQLN